jgi:hypothetical protein
MKGTTFNIGPGRKPGELHGHLEDIIEEAQEPEFLILEEAAEFRGSVGGYTRVAEDEGKHHEDRNTVILVRDGLDIVRYPFVHVGGPDWVGPRRDGRTHPPKVHPGVVVRDTEEHLWAILGVHRISGEKNPEAERTEWRKLEQWCDHRTPYRSTILMGDWNASHVSDDLRRFAARCHLDINLNRIDGSLTRNCRVTRSRVAKSKHGSDAHHPVTQTFVRG